MNRRVNWNVLALFWLARRSYDSRLLALGHDVVFVVLGVAVPSAVRHVGFVVRAYIEGDVGYDDLCLQRLMRLHA